MRADEARAAGFSWEIRRLRTFVEAAGAWRYSSARDVPAGLSAKEVSLACIVWLASAAISATSPRGAVFQEGKDRCERAARMRCELNSSCVGCRNVSGRRVWFVWISRSFAYSDRYKFWILQYRDGTLSNSAGFSCWSRENSCHALALPAPRRRAVRCGTKKIGDRAERTKSC